MELRDILDDLEKLVIVDVDDKQLDQRMANGIEKKVISGEQWFRNFNYWYATPAYANPYKTPFEELQLIIREEKYLKPYLIKTLKIYYGLGIGDTEIIPIMWDLSAEKYAEICAIDVIKDFIENFIQGLRNLIFYPKFLSSKINFLGYNTLFEKLEPLHFKLSNNRYNKFTHICFGNTIGNFDQKEIFGIFKKLVKPDDYLLVGYQLNIGRELILKQYRENFRFKRLIEACLQKFPELRGKEIEWKYNQETDYVEAKVNNILVFRSKKYDQKQLEDFAREFGFEIVQNKFKKPLHFKFGLVGVSLFRKI
jgi:hypothetical protein